MIACLVWGPGAAVSHQAAAALWRFLGFDVELVEVTVPVTRKRKDGPGIVHRGMLLPRDVTVIDGIPVTTPARTLFDIAATAPRPLVEEALDDALHRSIVTIAALRGRLERTAKRGRPGVNAMRSLLDARDPSAEVPQSAFETRLLRLLTRGKVPPPVLQHPVYDDKGIVGMIDFAWPKERVALEADGFRWHSARTRFERDRARRNRLTVLGWRVIHVTWTALTHEPEIVLDSVRGALKP
jgi:G:T-mismatch repair DNA endonuclease (very short patch repair protein)